MIHKPAYLAYTKFLALLLNHYTTVFCMLLRAFLNGLKMWKSHGDIQGVWHCLQHAIRRFLNSGPQRGGHCKAMPSMYLPIRGQKQYHVIFISSDRYESPQIHVGWRRAGNWHSGLRNRLWNSLHTRYAGLCVNGDSCTNACCLSLWCNGCTREHPQMGFSCICLTHLETTCMERYIQTETLHPETKLHLLRRKVNKKRRVNFTSIESLHFYN